MSPSIMALFILMAAPSASDTHLENFSYEVTIFYGLEDCEAQAASYNRGGTAYYYCTSEE